jgi:SAM-dependent methyltransferase
VNAASLRALFSEPGQAALAEAAALSPREEDFLRHFSALSRRYPAETARAALETAILRRESLAKFPFGERLYWTREALEQASSWAVASHRAGRYRGAARIADLGCAAGGDTLALAKAAPVIALDRDPLRLALACANLRALEREGEALLADLTAPLPFQPAEGMALFFDPARRSAGRRLYSVQDYQPPLSVIREWLPRFPALGVKLSPGVKLDELAEYHAEIEFISLHGELKEAVLWFGPLRSAERRATLLPGGQSLHAAGPAVGPLSAPLEYIFEPDPAVLRAGLVTALGAQIGAAQMDADIAYLTAAQLNATPFARAWAVEAWFPFGLKKLRVYLRQRGVGRVTVKKRGSPLQPEALIQQLHLRGDGERVLFLTHLVGKPIVIVALPHPL